MGDDPIEGRMADRPSLAQALFVSPASQIAGQPSRRTYTLLSPSLFVIAAMLSSFIAPALRQDGLKGDRKARLPMDFGVVPLA